MTCQLIRAVAWVKLALVAPVAAAALCLPATAQERPGSIQEEFEDAFFSHDEIFFNNRTIPRQVSYLFGIGFTDVEIINDGQAVHEVYETVMLQQRTDGPLLRTPDLANPYDSSLFTRRLVDEQVFDDRPLSQPLPPPPLPPGPVPALW
ncbi:MAG: hypothetical protein AAF289_06105 [Cyanobacteria bacterium P01_A01_bin.135]